MQKKRKLPAPIVGTVSVREGTTENRHEVSTTYYEVAPGVLLYPAVSYGVLYREVTTLASTYGYRSDIANGWHLQHVASGYLFVSFPQVTKRPRGARAALEALAPALDLIPANVSEMEPAEIVKVPGLREAIVQAYATWRQAGKKGGRK